MEQHQNLLAVYPHVLARLQTVPGIKTVKEIGELAELIKRKAAPLDGAVYVVFGGATPTGEAGRGAWQTYRLYFTFIYCATYTSGARSKLPDMGTVLTRIAQAFQGWQPEAGLTDGAFYAENPPAPEFHDGYAFYPATYGVDVSISLTNGA